MIPIFAEALHISVKAEPVFSLGNLEVTNSTILGVFGFILILIWLIVLARKASDDNSKKGFLTRLGLWIFTGLYGTIKEVIPDKRIRGIIAPFAITLFFYIAMQYYIGVLPFVGEAITWNGTPLLRGPDADLNLTFALAILTIILIQIMAIIKFGFFGNIGRYLRNPFKNPVGAFEGILEIIAEFSRLIALSMRLFGNVFAGEVLIMIVYWLTQFATPVVMPFIYIFELFIGGIQAYVFFSLAVIFASLAVNHEEEHTESDHSSVDMKKVTEGVE